MCLLCKKWKDDFKMLALISLQLEIISFMLFIRELKKLTFKTEYTHAVTQRKAQR